MIPLSAFRRSPADRSGPCRPIAVPHRELHHAQGHDRARQSERWSKLFWMSAVTCGANLIAALAYVAYAGLFAFPIYRIGAVFTVIALLSLLFPPAPPIVSFA